MFCEEACVNGRCIGPDICQCDDGYTGSLCEEITCPGTACLSLINSVKKHENNLTHKYVFKQLSGKNRFCERFQTLHQEN